MLISSTSSRVELAHLCVPGKRAPRVRKSKTLNAKEIAMLEFSKDGKKVRCHDIYDAMPGKILVLAHVSYEGCEEAKYPQMRYPQPAFFTVVKKEGKTGNDQYFILRDTVGKEILVRLGAGFYDAEEWVQWSTLKQAEDLRQKNARIQHVESQVALLRGILVDQGIRIVSDSEAVQLGLKK